MKAIQAPRITSIAPLRVMPAFWECPPPATLPPASRRNALGMRHVFWFGAATFVPPEDLT